MKISEEKAAIKSIYSFFLLINCSFLQQQNNLEHKFFIFFRTQSRLASSISLSSFLKFSELRFSGTFIAP